MISTCNSVLILLFYETLNGRIDQAPRVDSAKWGVVKKYVYNMQFLLPGSTYLIWHNLPHAWGKLLHFTKNL